MPKMNRLLDPADKKLNSFYLNQYLRSFHSFIMYVDVRIHKPSIFEIKK